MKSDCNIHQSGGDLQNSWESWHGNPRVQRGDMSPIVLRLLKEKSMHGYEIIRTLEDRSYGMWRPSAGSVYPILQMLEEQELVTSQEKIGKKIYSLTKKGLIEAAEYFESKKPWESRERAAARFMGMKDVMRSMMPLLKRLMFDGTDEQIIKVREILQETHDQLLALTKESDRGK